MITSGVQSIELDDLSSSRRSLLLCLSLAFKAPSLGWLTALVFLGSAVREKVVSED